MNTLEFLRYVLPESGYKFIGTYVTLKSTGDEWFKHIACESIEQAAGLVEELDRRGSTIYHACASFKEPQIDTGQLNSIGKPKYEYRVNENALAAKAFWVDVDVGKWDKKKGEPKGHQSREAALAAFDEFVTKYNLPKPLLINSGGGYHAYWALTKEIPIDKWRKFAQIFNEMASATNLQHDTACTVDAVRVLRPVGSTHRKTMTPIPVAVVGDVPPLNDTVEFVTKLVTWAKNNSFKPNERFVTPIQNDFAYTPDYPPSSAMEIVKHCKQLKDIASVRGDVEEPLWYVMIGLVKHTVEGENLCHEWSMGHEEYSAKETDRKISQWVAGPTTCQKFEVLNPSGCAGCPHQGKIKSPIQLGQVLPEQAPILVQEGEEEPRPFEVDFPDELREKYSWNGERLFAQTYDKKEKKTSVHPFSDILFVPTNYFRDPRNGHYKVIWTAYEKNGQKRDFELSGAATGIGGQALNKELGEQGIVAIDGQKKVMEAYVSSWFNALRKKTDEVNVFYQFGWQKDWSFVLGNRQYLPDGSNRKIRLTGNAAAPLYHGAFDPKGTLEDQVKLINSVYNHPGQEQYQLALGVAFGAPLVRLLENYGGLIISGYSPEKGLGKSTAGMLGLGLYGDPKMLVRTKQQTTVKAFNAHCGVMNSLPVMLDEATNVEPKALSEIAYTFSQGTPGQGLNPDGSMRTTLHNWSTLMYATANRSMINAVGAGKANADAEMGRILEYQFARVSPLGKEEADEVLHKSQQYYGNIGPVFIEYIVSHREEVTAMIFEVQKRMDKRIGATVADRFHSVGVAVMVTGLMIAKKLELVDFDIQALVDWTIAKVRKLHNSIQENLPPISDVIGNMLSELNSGFIVTNIEGDARASGKAAIVTNHPKGGIVTGRLIQEDNVLYVQQKVITQWCAKQQADYNEMWIAAVSNKWASPEVVNYSLGKGTKEYGLSPVRCWKMDISKMLGEESLSGLADKLCVIK
jgi:hypothetical protein